MSGQRRHLLPGILPTEDAALAHIAHHHGVGAHRGVGLKIFGPKGPKPQAHGLEFGQQVSCSPMFVVLPCIYQFTESVTRIRGATARSA